MGNWLIRDDLCAYINLAQIRRIDVGEKKFYVYYSDGSVDELFNDEWHKAFVTLPEKLGWDG